MKQYTTKYALGGPGPKPGTIDWDKLLGNKSSIIYDDPFISPTGATPPGAGQAINLSNATSGTPVTAYQPLSQIAPASNSGVITGTPVPRPARAGVSWNQVASVGSSLAPYASNIVNAFRKPPQPPTPTMDAPPVFKRLNFENQRYQVNREINAADVAADRTLASNTAQSVRQFNLGQRLNSLSRVNDAETMANTQIDNQQAMANAGVAAGNNAKWDDFRNQQVERRIAMQREQSANLSNAADKFVGIQNEKNKAKVDLEKARVLSSIYKNSGVLDRQRKFWKQQGIEDPLGMGYKDLKMYGGKLKKLN